MHVKGTHTTNNNKNIKIVRNKKDISQMPRSTKRYLQSYLKNPQWNFPLQKTTTTMKEKNKTKKNVLICALVRIKIKIQKNKIH